MAHRRRFVWLAAISLVLGFAGQRPHAQSQLPTLRLSTNQGIFSPGNTLVVNLGVQHTGAPMPVDLLFGVILPGSDAVVFFEGPGLVPGTGRVSQPASIRPMFASLAVGAGIDVLIPDFFRYTWQGQEPLGDYQFFFAVTRPGAFRDGRIDGGDLLALQMATVRHVPPATVSVDTSRAASAVVTIAGGTVTATGADGVQYALEVPAGAIAQSTTITVTGAVAHRTDKHAAARVGRTRRTGGAHLRRPGDVDHYASHRSSAARHRGHPYLERWCGLAAAAGGRDQRRLRARREHHPFQRRRDRGGGGPAKPHEYSEFCAIELLQRSGCRG